jgi:hypothetical protein
MRLLRGQVEQPAPAEEIEWNLPSDPREFIDSARASL